MPTPAERRALLFVAAVAALGLAVRGGRSLRPSDVPATDREALARQIAAVESAMVAGGRSKARSSVRSTSTGAPAGAVTSRSSPGRATPGAAVPAPVDIDRADTAELVRLPGIGPALAQRIVDDRAAHGGFGSLQELQRVRGIGPALAARLAPYVTFSAPLRPARAAGSAPARAHP